jgi:urea transporter
MNFRSFWAELKRRRVYSVAVAYIVAGWLLIQVAPQVPFFDIAWRNEREAQLHNRC